MKGKEKQIMKKMLDFYLGRDDEMFSVWIMKEYDVQPEEYVKIHTRFTELLTKIIEALK